MHCEPSGFHCGLISSGCFGCHLPAEDLGNLPGVVSERVVFVELGGFAVVGVYWFSSSCSLLCVSFNAIPYHSIRSMSVSCARLMSTERGERQSNVPSVEATELGGGSQGMGHSMIK